VPALGARPATEALELEDYERLFARRSIHTGVRNESVEGPLYACLLGSAWHELPHEIRAMHDLRGESVASGTARVERGASWLARLAAAAFRFPPAAEDVPVTVRFTERAGVETWTRTFGRHRFSSVQFAGRGRAARLLCERFGPATFAMALVCEGGRLTLVPRRWSVFGVPLPLRLGPRSNAFEFSEHERFHFHVEISHPLCGLIVRYRGSLSSPERV
jgi:hypothetical protein